jgi:hypothetical protein
LLPNAAEVRDPRVRVKKKNHVSYWSEVQEIYRSNSPAAAREMCRLALEAEDDRTRAVCVGMVLERAWGRPKDFDPNQETPKKAPPFDPKLYTTDELRRMQEVMLMIAQRQGMMPEEGEDATS